MRLSHCESHCAGPFLLYVPCLPKSKDGSGGGTASAAAAAARSEAGVVAAAEERPPPVQKIEVAVPGKDDDDDEKRENGVKVAPKKSSLKQASCGESKCAAKGNVQWLDLLGKDLTEVKEFEPSERGDSPDDGDGTAACACVIQ